MEDRSIVEMPWPTNSTDIPSERFKIPTHPGRWVPEALEQMALEEFHQRRRSVTQDNCKNLSPAELKEWTDAGR